ncbi:MAG TPA: Crp/Fnr family transcriptional regulator [Candidatus Saccharimonadales bacterium]|nr:Crp/Fnr family transcriptional regulator [Candidatus Saccharimonadales bacterium]
MLANMKQTAEMVDFFRLNGLKQTFKKNDIIIPQGSHPNGVYYVLEGLVKAYDITKYNEENLLVIRKADEIFPLIWAITGHDRQVIYQAIAPSTVYKVSRKVFLDHINNNPDALSPLLDMTMEMYRLHSERIFTLEYRTVRERIISFLLNMNQRFGKRLAGGEILIDVPLRHQDIASSVNATRETTSREIAALERKGYIENKQSYITIKDFKALNQHL